MALLWAAMPSPKGTTHWIVRRPFDIRLLELMEDEGFIDSMDGEKVCGPMVFGFCHRHYKWCCHYEGLM